MADPPQRDGKDGKMPWGMKIGKLKPGARETITDKKLATFVVGKQKKSRLQKVGAARRWKRARSRAARGRRLLSLTYPAILPPPSKRTKQAKKQNNLKTKQQNLNLSFLCVDDDAKWKVSFVSAFRLFFFFFFPFIFSFPCRRESVSEAQSVVVAQIFGRVGVVFDFHVSFVTFYG